MEFWNRINLRVRIYVILSTLVAISFLGGLVIVWYTYRMEGLMDRVIGKNLTAFEIAWRLETDLATQKGFVSYYFMDGNPAWLKDLAAHRRVFKKQLEKVLTVTEDQSQRFIVAEISSRYAQYVASMDEVIQFYKAGEREKGEHLQETLRPAFAKILALSRNFKNSERKSVEQIKDKSYSQGVKLRVVAATAVLIVLMLGLLLAFLLVRGILEPLRLLAQETFRENGSHGPEDDVSALKEGVHGLMEEYDQTYFELKRSREHLMQSEKMALVGKLAAGTAHSIRNPLTSVKMRLFSLNRSLDLDSIQQEDFDVISQEIDHVDNIMQNFLEFSRPPKLMLQGVSPSEVIDQTVLLLQHRLESSNTTLTIQRRQPLPKLQADPEQLKEAFVNIVVNACEAMEPGGAITVREEEKFTEKGDRQAIITFSDNGPGIPKRVQTKVFEPFFTTKEAGSGLGLSIVARIIQQHGGQVDVESEEGQGTSFIVMLPVNPVQETAIEQNSDHR